MDKVTWAEAAKEWGINWTHVGNVITRFDGVSNDQARGEPRNSSWFTIEEFDRLTNLEKDYRQRMKDAQVSDNAGVHDVYLSYKDKEAQYKKDLETRSDRISDLYDDRDKAIAEHRSDVKAQGADTKARVRDLISIRSRRSRAWKRAEKVSKRRLDGGRTVHSRTLAVLKERDDFLVNLAQAQDTLADLKKKGNKRVKEISDEYLMKITDFPKVPKVDYTKPEKTVRVGADITVADVYWDGAYNIRTGMDFTSSIPIRVLRVRLSKQYANLLTVIPPGVLARAPCDEQTFIIDGVSVSTEPGMFTEGAGYRADLSQEQVDSILGDYL